VKALGKPRQIVAELVVRPAVCAQHRDRRASPASIGAPRARRRAAFGVGDDRLAKPADLA
jgi:hypothetical protein